MWLLSYSVFCLILSVFTWPSAKNYKLFNQPPTVRLTAQNFAQEVNFSSNPWLIVVYSEASESCQSYSKLKWRLLVKIIGDDEFWMKSPTFGKNRVAAIEKGEGIFATEEGSFAADENIFAADEYDFPIIKIFPPNSSGVPLNKKIDPEDLDAIFKILFTIHIISNEFEVWPETSQEWTTLIDETLKKTKELALAEGKDLDKWVVVETHTQIIRTTTRVENPFPIFSVLIAFIFLLLVCCKWIVKCFSTYVPEDVGDDEPVMSLHRDPGYSYDHPQPQARSEAIPLSAP